MKKILAIADLHDSPAHLDEVEWLLDKVRWYQWLISWLGIRSWLAKRIIRFWVKKREKHVREVLTEIAGFGPFDLILSLGDETHGEGSHGLVSHRARRAAWAIKAFIKKIFRKKNRDLVEVPGNHDVGYAFATGAPSDGGSTPQSLRAFETIHGPQFGAVKISGYLLLWLNAETFLASPNGPLTPEQYLRLEADRLKQQEFLQTTLKETTSPVILLLHDSGALLNPELSRILDHYCRPSNRLVATLAGHIHARWLYWLYITFINRSLKKAARDYRVQIIPSVWGVYLLGAGWATLTLESSWVSLEIKYLNSRRPRRINLTEAVF